MSLVGTFVGSLLAYTPTEPPETGGFDVLLSPVDSTEDDSNDVDLIYPFDDKSNEGYDQSGSPLYMGDPSNVKKEFRYDPETGEYNYFQKIGEDNFRNPNSMTLDEYLEYDMEKSQRDFWRQKSNAQSLNQSEGYRPQINVKGELFDRIFGGNTIDIRPQGSAELSFGVNVSRRDNPILPERQRRTSTFDFNQRIQLNVIGNIGEKLKIQTNYNTEATFDFENQTKLEYTGYEDEIIKKVEAGNVALPLQSTLITGSQTLFGIKTELQFGRLRVTTLFSQEKGEKKEINIAGGAQVQEFEKSASEYEDNRHYFLSHIFRDSYERSLATPPQVVSLFTITALEVYITNTQGSFNNTRNILGFTDLGNDRRIHNDQVVQLNPGSTAADNNANDLYQNLTGGFNDADEIRGFNNADEVLQREGLRSGVDYERLENAVLLSPNEYTFNAQLGYISLNRTLNPQDVLAVSFRYSYKGQEFQVGDLSTDGVSGQQALFLKLLKGTIINPSLPSWDLMMKNVYSLDAFNVSPDKFQFEIWYLNQETGVEIPYFPEGKPANVPLINTLALDRMTVNNEAQPDGLFDFIQDFTITPRNGKIYFPVLEPFGDYLKRQFNDPALGVKYAYDSLYTTTKILAQQDVDHNRYTFRGRYQSSSGSEISLNTFNIPQGSVTVTAGGTQLVENVQYTVDYNLGRVRILDEGILASGQPIKVSLGSNSLFNVQTKTLLGSRFDYRLSEDINLGGTILNLTERPLTRKINIGDEPISNTIVGIDGSFTSEAPIVTKLADMIPFYKTNAQSTVTVAAEAARLFPGNSRAITKSGIAYIDDFEGSQTVIDIRSANSWYLASTPQGQDDLFPEGNLNGDRAYGYNRAKLAWYTIDPLFFRNDSRTPGHIRNSDSQTNNYSREIIETEVFPNRSPEPGLINNLPTLDLAFYPNERGPYNYETSGSIHSAGLNPDGSLKSPASRWGGIMRDIQASDFEASNVEFIQFWIMDPFNEQDGDPNQNGGQLYFNIGSISEDILKDGRKSFENGFPVDGSTTNTSPTLWGRIPTVQSVVNAFDNNPNSREFQDIGLDGLSDQGERDQFSTYLDTLATVLNQNALAAYTADPSNDNYHYYRGGDYDAAQLSILDRYKQFNGHQGNSPTAEQSPEAYPTAATTLPDLEDANRNFNLDRTESYYQYRVELSPDLLTPENVGSNFITDVVTFEQVINGRRKEVEWYQFKVPIRQPEKVIGEIRDFKSIRFMRMFLKGFDDDLVVRFARLGLVRGEWRAYQGSDIPPGDTHGAEPGATTFNIAAVNVEENSNRLPINYTIPPNINREIDFGTTNLRQLNEQSLVLDVCELQDGYSKFAFRYLDLDIRQYKKLKMFAHAEAGNENEALNDGDVAVVMRLGTDFENNYYEYEVPLQVSQPFQHSPESVWPSANEINLTFDKLIQAKRNRNRFISTPGGGVSVTADYEEADGGNTIRVRGNPNLAEVRVIMLGVRNRKGGNNNPNDDGLAKCAEVWVNELRLSDFNNDGGWAATARATMQVADLGTANLSGSYSTPGWGSLEQKLNERQRETRQQYDFSANLDIAKLLPDQLNLSIPFYYSISESIVRPEFNPLDPDVKLQELYNSNELTPDFKDSIQKITDDYTKRRSFNFTNVRKKPGPNKKKQNFYDVENLAFTYAYSETFRRDINTQRDNLKTYRGAINYNFAGKPKSIEPFKKIRFFADRKVFKLISDFNFNFVPGQVSIQNQLDRTYQERQARTITNSAAGTFINQSPAFYQKTFNWLRTYNLRHKFTKSITFNFTASTRALIGEPPGRVDRNDEGYDTLKREIWNNFRRFGENTNYSHNFNLSYNLPINKLPGLDFLSAQAQYSGSYSWMLTGHPTDTLSRGSTIANSNSKSLNATLNFQTLINKFQYVKDLKNPNIDNRLTFKEEKKDKEEKKEERKEKKEQKKKEKKPKGVEEESPLEESNNVGQGNQTAQTEEEEPDTTENKKFFLKRYLLDNAIWTLNSIRTINMSYSENAGTTLPNFKNSANILGMDAQWNSPGFGFVSGFQENGTEFLDRAFENDWLVEGLLLSGNFTNTSSKNISIRATLQPINGLRIQLTANKRQSENLQQTILYDTDKDTLPNGQLVDKGYNFDFPIQIGGTYSMSFLSFNTAFTKNNEQDFDNEVFQQMRANREIISARLGQRNDSSRFLVQDSLGGLYSEGYGAASQDVLLYSFLSAYSGESPNTTFIGDFTRMIPKPNWNITYDGLSKLDFFKRYFKSIILGHGYSSSFAVNYGRNQDFEADESGNIFVEDNFGNFIPGRQLTNATINERFSPLINVDMTWNNSLITGVELRRDRSMALSFTNSQITEVVGKEYIIRVGYRVSNLKLPFKVGKVEKASDLDLRADISIRDNQTVIRRIVENRNELTAGQRIFTIKFTADYRFSSKLNIRAFYDRVANTPLISSSFPTANTNAGISLRFTLSQ